ncbi:LysE family translocator [Almyronema epifaneia]|uniref:LysE family translocator n=1 Tax=Almyronema epifaneia S1 TaxID=2991925 RepID=A0ABW6IAA8_9CYAN
MPLLLQGLLLGLSIAAPVGPIGVLCIRRTLVLGRLSGLVSGLGAATADGFYGCVAGFGLTFLTQFLVEQTLWLRLIGGLFLIYLGAKIFVSQPAETAAAVAPQSTLLGAYFSTLALTLTNPATILSFVAIFAGLGIAEGDRSYLDSSVLVLGVFLGSALWWWLLSWSVNLFRARFNPQRLRWLNRVSGLVMTAFGVVALGWR